MASSNTLTYDDVPPHRPALSELGGGTKENRPGYAPNPVTMATAEDFNQMSKQLAALGAMAPLVQFDVTISAGTPVIANFTSLRQGLVLGDFTVTDAGVGSTQISWLATKLPPLGRGPIAGLTQNTANADGVKAFYTTVSSNPAVQVVTSVGGVATDINFTVQIY